LIPLFATAVDAHSDRLMLKLGADAQEWNDPAPHPQHRTGEGNRAGSSRNGRPRGGDQRRQPARYRTGDAKPCWRLPGK
jgi:hypothetical protein